MSDTPAIRAEQAEMAKMGMLRPEYPATGIQSITHGQQLLHKVDTAARITMNRFYTNLVEQGLAKNSLESRRAYVMQCGEYNSRLMGHWSRLARDSGMSPFLVAGRNFNRLGRRMTTGNLGIETTGAKATARLRATSLLRVGMLFTLPMMVNTILTGNPGGRSGVPLGAIDTGKDDKNGKHIIVDLLQITGIRRGLTSTGANAVIEGIRQGKNFNQIAGQATGDVTRSALHPWMGPAPAFAFKGVFGMQPDMRGQYSPKKVTQGGIAKNIEDFRAALESQNPLLYSLVKPAIEGKSEGYPGSILTIFLQSPSSAFGVKSVPKGKNAVETMIDKEYFSHIPDSAETPEARAKSQFKKGLLGDREKAATAYREGEISKRILKQVTGPKISDETAHRFGSFNLIDKGKFLLEHPDEDGLFKVYQKQFTDYSKTSAKAKMSKYSVKDIRKMSDDWQQVRAKRQARRELQKVQQ
jgi:hypothetical protein